MRSPQDQSLFSGADWFSVVQHQKQSMKSEIEAINGDRLLNTSTDDLCGFFCDKFRFDVPELLTDQIVVEQYEKEIDVSQDPARFISDRSRPLQVMGTLVEVTIPHSGNAEAFRIRPSRYTFSPLRGKVRDGVLLIKVQGTDLDPKKVRSEIDKTIGEAAQYLDWLRADVREFNENILQLAKERIRFRKRKLLADQNLVAALGFPLKNRDGTSKTFAAPTVRKRIAPTLPQASMVPYKPEPVLSASDYEHILSVMTNMALVMERSPKAFYSMDEQALRSHFLVQLNGHYEGQATGETFNYEGKTDILIRVEGKNIFVAECKYWRGVKRFVETIDQLLGYLSWRDTKTAIVVFNRNKNSSQVIESIPGAVKARSSFKKVIDDDREGVWRVVMAHRDDPNRELILTVLMFDVPPED